MSDVTETEVGVEEETEVQSVIEENLFNYLKELDGSVWHRLFRVKACLLALFRSLGELEKLIIYRLLYINQAVSERALRLWMCSHSIGDLKHSFALLQSYKIIEVTETTTKDGKQQYKLHKDFKNGLITLLSDDVNYKYDSDLVKVDSITNDNTNLTDRSEHSSVVEETGSTVVDGGNSVPTPNKQKNKPPVTVEELAKHAKLKLDFILLFLVSPDARKATLRVNKLFRKIKRLKKEKDKSTNMEKNIENLEKKFNRLSKNAGVISQDLLQILRRFGMVDPPQKGTKSAKAGETRMSRQTLSWLLKDVTSQMTSLLVGYLQNLDNGYLTNCCPMNRSTDDSDKSSLEMKETALTAVTESVELLLALSQSRTGDCFYTETLKKSQLRLVKLLNELGIVYYRSLKKFYIYDLSYLIGMSNSSLNRMNNDLDVNLKAGNDSRIIVQSNFKVYVYTASPLQISVLSHLCELQARTPNLVVGVLTRESVQSAFKSGITSNEIIRFLSPTNLSFSDSGGHLADSPFANYKIPENVCRQLKMWESERDRIELCSAILFKRWDSDFMPELFQRTVRWAQSKRYELFYTRWPSDPHSPEFEEWMGKEKYLACNAEFKEEIINQIRVIRSDISNERENKQD